MQVQTNIASLVSSLKDSSSVVHKKSLVILQTILKALNTQLSNQSDSNSCIIVLTVLYKQYKQAVQSNSVENSISYLILIQRLLPVVNAGSLEDAGVLNGMKDLTLKFLGFRYCLSVLTELVLVSKSEQTQYNNIIVSTLTQLVLKSTKTLERKQAGKNLRVILDNYPNFGNKVAEQTKHIIEQNTSSSIYMHSIGSIVGYFPAILLNDICYLLRPYLRVEEDTYNEDFISQAYFFLDTVLEKQLVTGQVSQQILKELIHNIPVSGDNKIIYGYLQCLHSSFLSLCHVNTNTSQRYLSSVVSVVSEMLLSTGRVPKQAEGVLKSIISNSVQQSLWLNTQQQFDLGNLQIDGESNSYKKLVAMLQDLLSSRYDQRRVGTFEILAEFFEKLEQSAFDLTLPLVSEIIQGRQRFQVGQFNILFSSVISAFGHQQILKLIPLSLNGDPTTESFQVQNNLWLLEIFAKTAPTGTFQLFVNIIFPLLKQSVYLTNKTQNPLRKGIYAEISRRFWAVLANCCEHTKKLTNFQECLEFIESNLVDENFDLPLVLNALVELLVHEAIHPKYFATKSQKFIPTLAKILDLSKQRQATNILKAIECLSKVCPPSYLERVFLKNINKLYSEKLNGKLTENQSVNSKNIEVLMAISHGVNFTDNSVTTFNGQSISKLECVVELLKTFLEEKNIFQKKAYKYLSQCMHYMPEGFISQVKDLLDKQVDILPSSRSYRLAVLNIAWFDSGFTQQDCDLENVMGFVKEYLPEIVLMLKQPNQKVRKLAHGLLVKMLETMNNFGIAESFVEMLCSGLASVSVSGKIDALTALTLSLGSLNINEHAEFAKELTGVVLVLLQDGKQDIIKAVIRYLKKYIFSFPSSKQSLPDIIKAIFETEQNSRHHVLHLIKRLLLKLVKRDSKDNIMKMIPLEHQRLLKSLMREEGKKKRQQRKKQLMRRQNQKKHEDSDSEDEVPKYNQNGMDVETTQEQAKRAKNNLLLKYDLDEQKFHFVDGKQKQPKKKGKKQQNNDEDDVAFVNGKLIVRQNVGQRVRPSQMIEQDEQKQIQTKAVKKIHKSYENALHQIKESGSSYKAARAKGDLRIKNKPEPHAFIQLNPKALNKRYKQKADKVFQNFFQKKQGGLKGLKARITKKK